MPGADRLIGRDAERRLLAGYACGTAGQPRSVLLLGAAGLGKSALLADCAEGARRAGMTVLSAWGTGIRCGQPFAGLHELLHPVVPCQERLRQEEARALAVALGEGPPGAVPAPLVLRTAVLNLLRVASRRAPVLLAVDDADLLDRDSFDVIAFVQRQLTGEAIAVALTVSGPVAPAGLSPAIPTITLTPLREAAAAAVLDAQPAAPTGPDRFGVLREAAGNPLAIVELCRAVAEGSGAALSTFATPQSERIRAMFAARLGRLPELTRRLVLLAAAGPGTEPVTALLGAAGEKATLADWVPAEEAGLVTVVGGRVSFRHPLVRAAAYHHASATARRQAHLDLALQAADDPRRRAWHLTGAALGPDPAAAQALEEAADQAWRKGAYFEAARAFQRAADCSEAPAERARRLVLALKLVNGLGDPAWAQQLHAQVREATDDPELLAVAGNSAVHALFLDTRQCAAFAIVSALLGRERACRRSALPVATLGAAIVHESGLASHRKELARLMDHVAADTAMGPAMGTGVGADAVDPVLPPYLGADASEPLADFVRAVLEPGRPAGEILHGRHDRLRRRAGLPPMTRLAIGSIAWFADDPRTCVEQLGTAFTELKDAGAAGVFIDSFPTMINALIGSGLWSRAEAFLEEADTVVTRTRARRLRVQTEALRALLRALRGEQVDAAALHGPQWSAVDLAENRASHAYLLLASGAAATAAGDHENAYRYLAQLFGGGTGLLHYFLSPRAVADLAIAAQRTGEHDRAREIIALVREDLGDRQTQRTRILLHTAEALVGEPREAEHHFLLAVVNPAGEQWPLDRAKARLHYGEWLRRNRRPLEARPLLATALETFTRIGAAGLAEHARAELRASGVARVRPSEDPMAGLTAQQQHIARLAAQGLRNREIAEKLYLSPRTVGSHLYNVYAKLGVTGRHQLRDLLERARVP
ncbi:AAA family ATPase [Amycolatopsis cynarae]|uniref:AAA family ATPase n=1 Tax=Amycolatopsis cynarae TaxID=2995223 RepID=A0ABY7BAK7_9PSEU|nr:LuxR family transcriptional regulator [Amycolatopsis sp. HUAS 11-8]WAL69386.1 AAA family ATPase [Amycolatopsis sp. HUAS 11-8]